MEAAVKSQRQMVRLRGRSYVAFVFTPTVPVQDWLHEIDATIARSPGFFAGRPVVIDLSSVDLSQSGIGHLLTSLQDRNIRVLGIEGVEEDRLTPSMPPLLGRAELRGRAERAQEVRGEDRGKTDLAAAR